MQRDFLEPGGFGEMLGNDVSQLRRTIAPNQRLLDILPVVLASEQRNIPVVNTLKENRLVGALPRGEVLGMFSEAIAASSKAEA